MRAAILALLSCGAFAADVSSFLSTYCTQCHGPSVQMANRRFDRLTMPPKDDDSTLLLQDIADQLTLGQMPPRAARQPTDPQRREIVESLTAAIASSQTKRASTGGRTILRRLNRREYANATLERCPACGQNMGSSRAGDHQPLLSRSS